jgi:hypothetical protein
MHRPLQGARSIRLLYLSQYWNFAPCEGCDQYSSSSSEVNFVQVSVDNPPPYLAVSYVWGDSRPKRRLPGGFPLTKSVCEILSHISAEYERPLHVWIDALCIDQENLEEKRVQIPLMRDIFRKAIQIIAWVPDRPRGNFFAGTRRHDLFTAADRITSYAKEKYKREGFNMLKVKPEVRGCQCSRDQGRELLFTYGRLFDQMWFQRIWVFQEVVCGSCIVIICKIGTEAREILWDDLYLFLVDNNLLQLDDDFGTGNQVYGSANVCSMAGRRYLQQLHGHESALTTPLQTLLIEASWAFEATDPRDKIYALLGLSNDFQFQDLKPAYAESLESLFTEVATLLLASEKSKARSRFAILSFAGIGGQRRLCNIPSWVPDWTSSSHRLRFEFLWDVLETPFEAISNRASFNATRGVTHDLPSVRDVEGSLTLSCSGVVIDTIRQVGHRYPRCCRVQDGHEEPLSDDYFPSKSWVTECKELAASVTPYCTGELAEDVLWRTLVADLRQDFLPWDTMHGETCLPNKWEFKRFFAALSGEVKGSSLPNNFVAAFEKNGAGRVLFTTEGGYLGLGPSGTKKRDQVCLIMGANVPYILRRSSSPHKGKSKVGLGYNLVGECYIRGIMHGERVSRSEWQEIVLI